MRGRVPPAPPSRAAVAVWTGSEYLWTVPTADGLVLTSHEDPDGRIWVRWEPPATGGGGGGAPTTAQYVALASDGTLTQERVLTATAGQLTLTDGGAGGPVTLAIASDPVLPGTGGVVVPTGTTAQRPGAPTAGTLRWNSSIPQLEVWTGSAWAALPGAGGSPTATTIEVNLGSTPVSSGKFTITDAAITATSKVLVWQAPGPYTGKGSRPDEAAMQPVQVIATVAGPGVAIVHWQTPPIYVAVVVPRPGGGRGSSANAAIADVQFVGRRLGLIRGNVKFSYTVFT